MNNPLKYTDPDGQNPIIIGAIIGGAVNVYTHWGQIKNGWDFAKAFGVGAVAGAATVWAGAGAIASMGLGTTGAISGFVGGGIGALVGSPIQIAGNFAFFGDAFTGRDYLKSVAMGAIGGALFGGIMAGIRGENFWWGNTVRTSPVTAIRDFLQKGKELYGKGSNSRMTIDEWIEWNTREGDNLVVHARQLTYEEASMLKGGSLNLDDDVFSAFVLNSASSSYKGTTVLGHALSKHAGRNPEIWGKLTGNPSTWHDQALRHFDDIMNSPDIFMPKTNASGIQFLEKMLPDGRGIRLNMNETFKGFID
jgi:hypothetical protein